MLKEPLDELLKEPLDEVLKEPLDKKPKAESGMGEGGRGLSIDKNRLSLRMFCGHSFTFRLRDSVK